MRKKRKQENERVKCKRNDDATMLTVNSIDWESVEMNNIRFVSLIFRLINWYEENDAIFARIN